MSALFRHQGRQYVAARQGRRLAIFVPMQKRQVVWSWLAWLVWALTFGLLGRRASIHRAARKALRAAKEA